MPFDCSTDRPPREEEPDGPSRAERVATMAVVAAVWVAFFGTMLARLGLPHVPPRIGWLP